MYLYFVILKGTNKELASCEIETLWKTYFDEKIKVKQLQNTFYLFKSKIKISRDDEIIKRLTLTNYIGEVLFEGSLERFEQNIAKIIEDKKIKSFAIRARRIKETFELPISEAKLAKPIFDNLQNPKVDLENPQHMFNFFFKTKNSFYFCERILENDKDYMRRMPKKRPKVMPYTLKSDIARVCVNLLGLRPSPSQFVVDPFCGQGGILLEAHDMGFKVIGNDISWNDLKYFKENFKHFFPKAKPNRILADSKNQFLKENSADGIVTDIPYGRASKKLGNDLYENFLKSAKKYLKPNKRLVIIYANFTDFKPLALKYFEEVREIDEYVNKSMTRHVLILENDK